MYGLFGAIGCISLAVIIGLICGVRPTHLIHCIGSSLIIALLLLAMGSLTLEFMGGSIVDYVRERGRQGLTTFK